MRKARASGARAEPVAGRSSTTSLMGLVVKAESRARFWRNLLLGAKAEACWKACQSKARVSKHLVVSSALPVQSRARAPGQVVVCQLRLAPLLAKRHRRKSMAVWARLCSGCREGLFQAKAGGWLQRLCRSLPG